MKLLIIGGSDAGISAALRAHEIDPTAEITVLLADSYPNYSICGLPFYLSGETPDWRQPAHRTEFPGIEILPKRRARLVNPSEKHVLVQHDGVTKLMPYDRLVIGTGAVPVEPKISGLERRGVHLLPRHGRWDQDSELHYGASPKVGINHRGGLHRARDGRCSHPPWPEGHCSQPPAECSTYSRSGIGCHGTAGTGTHGVEVWPATEIVSIQQDGRALAIHSKTGAARTADLVLVATGVQPSSELAEGAGLRTGIHNAIRVNEKMETSVPDIFAAGDCAETWHRLSNSYTYLPLGTTSHKQGRVAGENAAGGDRAFKGAVGTQVVKVFELAIARTGLLPTAAKAAGFDPFTIETKNFDHKAYYPSARELHMRITGDGRTGRLLGAQLLGHWKSEVSKRIDTFATALFHEMNIEDLNDLDLSYTPPLGNPWDPIQIGAQVWSRCQKAQVPVGDCKC